MEARLRIKNSLKRHCLGKFATKAFKHNHRVIVYPFVFIFCHYGTIFFECHCRLLVGKTLKISRPCLASATQIFFSKKICWEIVRCGVYIEKEAGWLYFRFEHCFLRSAFRHWNVEAVLSHPLFFNQKNLLPPLHPTVFCCVCSI